MTEFIPEELFQAFSKIRPNSSNYCTVCLRPGEQRRLVQPVAFKKFLSTVYVDYQLDPNSLICFICENHAEAACRFYRATMFAVTIKFLFKDYMASRKIGTGLVKERRRFQKVLEERKANYGKTIQHWDSDLKNIRQRSELQQTDVMVIDNLGIQMDQADGESEMFILPNDPAEATGAVLRGSGAAEATSVIVIDDEEAPAGAAPPAGLFARAELNTDPTPPVNTMPMMPSIKLVPVLSSMNTVSITPSMNPVPITPSMNPVPITPSMNPVPITPSINPVPVAPSINTVAIANITSNVTPRVVSNEVVLEQSTGGFILHPVVVSSNGQVSVPSLQNNAITNCVLQVAKNNKIINASEPKKIYMRAQQQQQIDSSTQPPAQRAAANGTGVKGGAGGGRLLNYDFITELANEIRADAESSFNNQIVSDHAKRKQAQAEPIIVDVKSGEAWGNGEAKKMKVDEVPCKLPVQKNDRIDWEDKIPIDVISFMDATDPNAGELYYTRDTQKQQYQITQVKSLSEAKSPCAGGVGRDGVIDLC